MNRTNRCYFSFSSRRMAVWGAHAYRVLVKTFCLHELPNCFYGLTSCEKRKVRCRKMRQPARYKRALPRTLSTRHLYFSNE
jgi:hypothetical protein